MLRLLDILLPYLALTVLKCISHVLRCFNFVFQARSASHSTVIFNNHHTDTCAGLRVFVKQITIIKIFQTFIPQNLQGYTALFLNHSFTILQVGFRGYAMGKVYNVRPDLITESLWSFITPRTSLFFKQN